MFTEKDLQDARRYYQLEQARSLLLALLLLLGGAALLALEMANRQWLGAIGTLLAIMMPVMGVHVLASIIQQRRRWLDIEFIHIVEGLRWKNAWSETEYTKELAKYLTAECKECVKHQAPLQEIGTRFDLCATYRGEKRLITVKKLTLKGGFHNQLRLLLQGEIEDAVRLFQLKGQKRLHVLVVLGLFDHEEVADSDPETLSQIDTLRQHLDYRRARLVNPKMPSLSPYDFDVTVVPINADDALRGATGGAPDPADPVRSSSCFRLAAH